MTAPAPPPPPGGPGQTITVTPDNVLQARRIIGQAAEDAKARLHHLQHDLRVSPAARDDISTAAAVAWNRHLLVDGDSHFQRLISYVSSVEQLGNQLEEAAKQYGFTDEEIAASFRAAGSQQ